MQGTLGLRGSGVCEAGESLQRPLVLHTLQAGLLWPAALWSPRAGILLPPRPQVQIC
jgi:hypothetical protein